MPINILMPALSPTMTEGTLAKWLKTEGDSVESGDVIAEIETDKATMEVEAVDDGVIGKIIVQAGTEHVAVNDTIAVLLEEGETDTDIGAAETSDATVQADTPKVPLSLDSQKIEKTQKTDSSVMSSSSSGDRVFASPLAKRIAKDKGIDLSTIKGTGPKGRIIKADVEGFDSKALTVQKDISSSSSQSASSSVVQKSSGPDAKALSDMLGMEYDEIPNNNIRKMVASRLSESKQTAPHFYLNIDCELDALLDLRKKINAQADGAYKVSVNDFIIKACALALKDFPDANVAWTDDAILQFKSSDISVAVATDNGLITPIVKSAETKGLRTISEETKDLAGRAREGKLQPHEFQGGTFTVSNLGMFGIKQFSAILNPPQGCILAIGAGVQQPVVKDGALAIATVMSCTLSVDHRSVDGAVGAQFLKYFKQYIENPFGMLV